MKLCRFLNQNQIRVGLLNDGGTISDLSAAGVSQLTPLLERALSEGSWRLVATIANRMPTAASYLKVDGDDTYRAFKFDVLRVVDGRIAEITTFGPMLFAQFGLPETLEG